MPGGSSIQQFIRDLKDGQSNITRKLNDLFGVNPGRHASAAPGTDERETVDWLVAPAAPGSPPNFKLHAKAKTILRTAPHRLKLADIAHIDAWPDDQRGNVLAKLAKAIRRDIPCHFSWELHEGTGEVTVIEDPDAAGQISIKFRTPRKNVSLQAGATGQVTVAVNP